MITHLTTIQQMVTDHRQVVVEGPDGAGKSTLIDSLGMRLAPRHVNSAGKTVDNLAEWVEVDLVANPDPPWVYDRHPLISEPIYGSICRGRPAFRFDSFTWLQHKLGEFIYFKKPLVIICLPPLVTVKRNILQNAPDQMEGVLKHIEAIYYSYVALAARLTIAPMSTTLVYDYTREL